MVPGREIYWNISGYLFQYLFLGCSLAICTYGFWRRYRKWRAGTPSNRSGAVKKRIVTVAKQMISHSRIFGYPFTGIFHYSLVMAFFVLFLGTTAVFFEADFGIQILSGKFYLYFQSLALDTAGFVALIGIGSAVFQRFVTDRPVCSPVIWFFGGRVENIGNSRSLGEMVFFGIRC